MRPCRRPDRLSRRLERKESPEAMLTHRLRRGRRGAVALLLSHAHTPELEASTPSPKCACLTGTDPSAGLRRGRRRRSGPKLGRRSRGSIGLIATRRQEEPNATRTLDPGITLLRVPRAPRRVARVRQAASAQTARRARTHNPS